MIYSTACTALAPDGATVAYLLQVTAVLWLLLIDSVGSCQQITYPQHDPLMEVHVTYVQFAIFSCEIGLLYKIHWFRSRALYFTSVNGYLSRFISRKVPNRVTSFMCLHFLVCVESLLRTPLPCGKSTVVSASPSTDDKSFNKAGSRIKPQIPSDANVHAVFEN